MTQFDPEFLMRLDTDDKYEWTPKGFSFDELKVMGAKLTASSNLSCIQCCVLPVGQRNEHTVVAVTNTKTIERAWFNPRSLKVVQKYADHIQPNDGALGDWRYAATEFAGVVVETMTLTLTPVEGMEFEAAQYIWKLTHIYDDSMATSWLTGLGPMRLGVWAD